MSAKESKWNKVIEEQSLYPSEFVEKFGKNSIHWEKSSPLERELSLRHDMVCVLLANLESYVKKRKKKDKLPGPPKKMERLSEPSSSTSSGSKKDTGPPGEMSDDDSSEEEAFTLVERLNRRFIVLEGLDNPFKTLSDFQATFGLPKNDAVLDILDMKEGRAFEVKVGMNRSTAFDRFMKVKKYNYEHMVFVNTDGEVFCDFKFPGEEKVFHFLQARKNFISRLGSMEENELYESEDLFEATFKCSRFNEARKKWVDSFWDYRFMEAKMPETPKEEWPYNYTPQAFKIMVDKMLKKREGFPPCEYRGKILPHHWTEPIVTELEEDNDMLSLAMKYVEGVEVHNKIRTTNAKVHDNILLGLKELLAKWETGEAYNYAVVKPSEFQNYPTLSSLLGVDRKETSRFDDHPLLVQEDYETPSPTSYHPWVSHLIEQWASNHEIDGATFLPEGDPDDVSREHPFAGFAQMFINKFYSLANKKNIVSTISAVQNTSSRLAGAYISRNKKGTSQNNIVAFPIYANCNIENQSYRRIQGIMLRGPHHPKRPTDRINVITIEFVQIKKGYNYWKHTKKGFLFRGNGTDLLVRQNAYLKHDLSYLMFIQNTFFLSANSLGELILNKSLGGVPLNTAIDDFTNRYGMWTMERAAESLMMAITGGSQEEGALASIRKVFMILLAWKRVTPAAGWSHEGLLDSIDECVIDNALAHYYLVNMKIALDHLQDLPDLDLIGLFH